MSMDNIRLKLNELLYEARIEHKSPSPIAKDTEPVDSYPTNLLKGRQLVAVSYPGQIGG
jgi:hypothetical protein